MNPSANIRVNVDVTNPGQYFSCCALLELADRLWPGALGWFQDNQFLICSDGDENKLINAIRKANLTQLDLSDVTASPIEVSDPFPPFRLDWWQDEIQENRRYNLKELKVWAGTMESFRIALAMQDTVRQPQFHFPALLDIGGIAFDVHDSNKKVEPYYFDARRAPNSDSRDVGFSINDLGLKSTAYPAVELLCLIGLQFAHPQPTETPRIFDYFTWKTPIPPLLLLPAVTGKLNLAGQSPFRFEVWYRTSQKKHKAFRPSQPLTQKGGL